MKKFLSIILSICMLLSITAGLNFSAFADTDGFYEYEIIYDEKTDSYYAEITDVDDEISGDITIPATLGGYTVKSIGEDAFYKCTSLTNVTIGNSVTSIGGYAFAYCDGIESVTIPVSVNFIGSWAFSYCASLKNIQILNNKVRICGEAFYDTAYYNDASNWENNVLYIGKYLIDADVEGVCEIKEETISIADYAFGCNTLLKNVSIPNSVKYIGEDAFMCCASLESIVIPNSVLKIGDYAFRECTQLKSVSLSDSITSIGRWCFYCCDSLTSIKIPDGVTSIGARAFDSCDNLEKANIPDGVTEIGDRAFAWCQKLNNLSIPASVESIGKNTFGGCKSISAFSVAEENQNYCSVDGIILSKDKKDIIAYPAGKPDKEFIIPSYVKTINDCSFIGCKYLEKISVPDNVTNIGESAFAFSTSLSDINLNGNLKTISRWMFESCTSIERIVIPDGIETICDSVFWNCTNLKNIIILDSVTEIQGDAFGYYEYFDEDREVYYPREKIEELTVYGSKGSEAERYANENGFKFATDLACTNHIWDNGDITTEPSCKSEGVKTYHCIVCLETKTEPIAKSSHKTTTVTTKATLSVDGKIVTKCAACGTVTSTKTIAYPKTITLSATSYTYDGKVKKPSVTVKDSKGNKIASSNYTVSYAGGRKNVGKYAVKITFKGNYSGTKTLYFTIVPKATSINSVTASSKAFTVKWKKQATQTTGYEIQYATDSKFTKNKKTVTISKNNTTSKKISKLSAKKKYYVRVRTYKTVKVNGKSTKLYSGWSKVKTVTTKK